MMVKTNYGKFRGVFIPDLITQMTNPLNSWVV